MTVPPELKLLLKNCQGCSQLSATGTTAKANWPPGLDEDGSGARVAALGVSPVPASPMPGSRVGIEVGPGTTSAPGTTWGGLVPAGFKGASTSGTEVRVACRWWKTTS